MKSISITNDEYQDSTGTKSSTESHLGRIIEKLLQTLPSPSHTTRDLQQFAKSNDRRSFQLIKFCITPESDYRTIQKSIVSAHLVSPVKCLTFGRAS